MFVDKATIKVISGKGGNGAVTFRHEPFVPEGGPDGGDGGKGGDVIVKADRDLRTLMDHRYKKKYKAENGQDGMRKKCYGKNGEDLIIKVPVGTIVYDKDSGLIMADLISDGQEKVICKGGKGGKGNTHFKSSVRQAPDFAEAGERAQERELILELKMIADVGLVGFPNAGKSSLLSASTNARPKIASYHFTTLEPNLGVSVVNNSEFVIADIAGLIEGAHNGDGLGFEFLKHIERTGVLIHVVDVSASEGREPSIDFEKIMNELSSYSPKIMKKPMLVAANKMDIADSVVYEDFKKEIEDKGYKVFPISAATGEGVDKLLLATLEALSKAEPDVHSSEEMFDFDAERDYDEYSKILVTEENGIYSAEGEQLQKIFDSTNFNDMTSLRYLYKYLEDHGAIRKMKELGMKEGDTISIYGVEFDYVEEF